MSDSQPKCDACTPYSDGWGCDPRDCRCPCHLTGRGSAAPSEREAAFKRVMGAIDMPDDKGPDYDEWLFNAAWQAARAGAPQAASRDDMFWPPANEEEEHLYEIRNGKTIEYVFAHLTTLTGKEFRPTKKALDWDKARAAAVPAPGREKHWDNVGYELLRSLYAYREAHDGVTPGFAEMGQMVKHAYEVSGWRDSGATPKEG